MSAENSLNTWIRADGPGRWDYRPRLCVYSSAAPDSWDDALCLIGHRHSIDAEERDVCVFNRLRDPKIEEFYRAGAPVDWYSLLVYRSAGQPEKGYTSNREVLT